MTQPLDQRLLYRDLCRKLADQAGPDQLIGFMGAVLCSLLRRKGDAEFLVQVQDAFTDGLGGLSWDEQVHLSREVIAMVIAKRPEIALAWQKLQGETAQFHRRTTDQTEPSAAPAISSAMVGDLPDLDLIKEDLALDVAQPDRPAPEPAYEFAAAETLVADYVCSVLERRLGIFAAPETRFPSVAYCHEQPFFLFTPVFSMVTRRFVTNAVMKLCREPMERHVFRHIPAHVMADAGALDAVLTEKRPDLWKILIERLGKLAAHHRNAEAKLAAARASDRKGPEFQVVEMPVSRPRVFRALGVAFRLGSRTKLEKMRVRVRPSTDLDAHEMQALDLIARFGDMAAQAGLGLPGGCDFTFLRTLLEFDAKKYAQTVREFTALADHKETTRQYLLDRVKFVEETYANTLADALVILLFYGSGDDSFGFKTMYDICIGTALDDSARATQRPFLQAEIARRPRELAFQVREVLRRRYDEDTLRAAVRVLLEVWQTLSRSRFAGDMEAALTVFSAFPIAFAGDHDEHLFTAIGHMLHRALSTKEFDAEAVLTAVVDCYHPVAAKLRAEAHRG